VVGSDVGGIGRNVEQDASGFLYEPDDTERFTSRIEMLAQDPELRQRFGKRGREIVSEGFTQEVLASEFQRAIGIE
jgi:glycosyltransferase involved in cell wall biosynthesis